MNTTKLSNFLELEENNKLLIFDLNNLAYRVLHIAYYQAPDDDEFYYWRYLMINSIFPAIKMFDPSKVIIAVDHPYSWRKTISSEYKANRKEKRDVSKIDFVKFYKVLDNFIESFKTIFTNMYVIKIERCEADDIIAITSRDMFKNYKKFIISMDSDLNQLLQFKNVKIYNPINKNFVECINPKMALEIKILTGDKTDNISAIRPKVGVKTAMKLLESGLDILLQSDELKAKYQLNKQLIDFDYIPLEYINKIQLEINNYKIEKIKELNLFNWLMENKIQKYAEDLSIYLPFLRRIG